LTCNPVSNDCPPGMSCVTATLESVAICTWP
jgi:hypothetical protein